MSCKQRRCCKDDGKPVVGRWEVSVTRGLRRLVCHCAFFFASSSRSSSSSLLFFISNKLCFKSQSVYQSVHRQFVIPRIRHCRRCCYSLTTVCLSLVLHTIVGCWLSRTPPPIECPMELGFADGDDRQLIDTSKSFFKSDGWMDT